MHGLGIMQLHFPLLISVLFNGAYAVPQSKGGGGGADLIGSLLKGMGGSVPFGPAPAGCSKYEILVGMQLNTTPKQVNSSIFLTAYMTKPVELVSRDRLAALLAINSSAR
jgi:hypothetical protein